MWAAYQPSHPLGQQNRRSGQRNLGKTTATVGVCSFHACGKYGIIRWGKGNAVDNDQPAGITGHIHALPQTHGTGKHGTGLGAKLFDQPRNGVPAALHQEWKCTTQTDPKILCGPF